MSFMGVEQTSVLEEAFDPNKQYLITGTPHGAYAVSGLVFIAPKWRLDPNYRVMMIGASILFLLPVVRELILLLGGREVTRVNTERLITAGLSIGMIPGGIWEQVNTDHMQEKTYVHKNLGFLRLAIKHRLHVVPMYGFGENQLFTTHNVFTSMRQWLARKWVGLPLITPLPRPTAITHVFAPSIDTGTVTDRVTREYLTRPGAKHTVSEVIDRDLESQVLEAVYEEYRSAMLGMFERHKHLLPPEVAKRGLIFVRLGQDQDPSVTTPTSKREKKID